MSVRITQSSVNRSYLTNLNKSNYAMNQSMQKIETGRAFNKVSENVPDATRAMDVRVRLYKNEQMQDNVSTAIEQLNMADGAIGEMTDICSTTYADMLRALNGSNLTSSKEAFLAALEGSKEEILRLANTDYNNKYVMGGTGTKELPFKDDGNGSMTFNGAQLSQVMDKQQAIEYVNNTPVSDCKFCNDIMNQTCKHGEPYKQVSFDEYKEFVKYDVSEEENRHYWITGDGCDNAGGMQAASHPGSNYSTDEQVKAKTIESISNSLNNYFSEAEAVKYSNNNYMDIGLDMAGGNNINSKSSFMMSVDGVAAMGYGKSTVTAAEMNNLIDSSVSGDNSGRSRSASGESGDQEVSNNIYDMMTEMQKAIEDEDVDRLSAVLVNFKKQTDNLITSRSEIGVRTKYLETTLNRLENENVSLSQRQNDLEGVDEATEITNYMNYQNAWNLTLRFGGNVIPKSLMDYI